MKGRKKACPRIQVCERNALFEVSRKRLRQLVVAGETMDARLNENETELGVLVLPVAFHVLADIDRLFDEEVQILGNGWLLAWRAATK